MKKNSIQVIMLSLILAASLPASAMAAKGQVTRVGEADRYATAAKVATTNWSSPKDLVLVCGEGYADAVSASVLAKQLDAPILLTNSKTLNENTKKALDTLKPENVYVIGGSASISQSIRNSLKSYKYNVIELSGKNRYETNAAVANQLVKLGVKPDNVMLVSGEGFSDALSVAPVAAAKGQILLLGSNSSSEMKSIFDFVEKNKSKVTVIGTSYAINDSIYSKLGAVSRIPGGANRFETNLNVLKAFQSDLKTDKIFVANASNDGYADALVASSLAGKWGSNLVLVDGEDDSNTSNAIEYIKSRMGENTDLNVIGGTGVISNSLVSKMNPNAPTPEPSTDIPTVKSVTARGLNQIKVTFNTEVDKDTAEILSNYQVDGVKLDSNYKTKTSASLQDDKRTVLITFSEPFDQQSNVNFKVKKSILDSSQQKIIDEYEEKINFFDNTNPTIESITPRGGNKLIIRFSEPIRLSMSNLTSIKINKQNIQNLYYNESQSELLNKSGDWADGIELYFDEALPEGDNTITLPEGNVGSNFDSAARFPFKGITKTFNIKPASGVPKVNSVKCTNSDTVYITYNRAMDKQTALNDSNYKINNKVVNVNSYDISFEEGSNDSVVKIKNTGDLIKQGENKIVISDNIVDTYGYSIEESTNKFTIGQDNIKPQVTSVNIMDNDIIRVKFNKTVSNSSACNKSNYKIVDSSDGEDIAYKIDSIGSVSGTNGDNEDTYDLKFKNSDDLNSPDYKITISNIYDTNSPVNVMESYTTNVAGKGDKVEVTSIVKKSDSSRDVVIFFNKAMDEDTLSDPKNYFFIDGTGDTRTLPSSTVITPSSDDKSVTISFSSGYIVGQGTSEKYVRKMGVKNVKDKNGKELDLVSYKDDISENYNDGPKLIEDTAKLNYDNNNIKIRVSLTNSLEALNIKDFEVAGYTPDSGSIEGKDVILIFKNGVNNDEKISAIRSAGASTIINVSGGGSEDAAGRKIKTTSIKLYLPPITNSDSWIAKSANSSSSYSTVTMTFNQDIDSGIASTYMDDFIFINRTTGEKLNVTAINIDNSRDVVYKFDKNAIKTGDQIDVRMNDDLSKLNIRGKQRNNGSYVVMTPSRQDLIVKTITAN